VFREREHRKERSRPNSESFVSEDGREIEGAVASLADAPVFVGAVTVTRERVARVTVFLLPFSPTGKYRRKRAYRVQLVARPR
jgi:hypothetical protein